MRPNIAVVFAVVLAGFPLAGGAAPGDITTVAGDGGNLYFAADEGNPAIDASIATPVAIAFDPSDGSYYICTGNRIRRVDSNGIITHFAGAGAPGSTGDGGQATEAQLNVPQGIAVDSAGNVFISDSFGKRLRRVDATTGIITTIAGNGVSGNTNDGMAAQTAQISPEGMEFDAAGNLVIACGPVVRRILAGVNGTIEGSDIIERVAGTGSSGMGTDGVAPTSSQLGAAVDIAIDGLGDIYIADVSNHVVRKIDVSENLIDTVAGDATEGFADGTALAPKGRLDNPFSIAVDTSFNLFICDSDNERIRKLSAVDGLLVTIAGTGNAGFSGDGFSATSAELDGPVGIAVGSMGALLFGDRNNHRVRSIESAAVFNPFFQPDSAVGPRTNRLRGKNIYGGTAHQKYTESVRRKRTNLFYFLQNDGDADDLIRARTSRGSTRRVSVRWVVSGRNVTGTLLTNRYVTPSLAPQTSILVRGLARIRSDRGASAYRYRCTSESDPSRFDQGFARLVIRSTRR